VERDLHNAKPVTDASGRLMTPAEIAAVHTGRQKQTRAITIRFSIADIGRAKAQAERKGLGYQTYLKSLIHQVLVTK
jgi:predicted DNA binding CopG/RHH family protein